MPPRALLAVLTAAAALAAVVVASVTAAQLSAGAQDQEPDTAAVRSGEELYQQNCATCHGTAGDGTYRGPTLRGAGAASADFYLRTGRMPISDPSAEVERSDPEFTDEQIRALVDYVAALSDGPPIPEVDLDEADRSAGGELYRLNCAACHNWDGKGGALIGGGNAPDLHQANPVEIAEAVRVGPGSMPNFDEDALSADELDDLTAFVAGLDHPRDRGGFDLAHWGPTTETVAALLAVLGLLVITRLLGATRR